MSSSISSQHYYWMKFWLTQHRKSTKVPSLTWRASPKQRRKILIVKKATFILCSISWRVRRTPIWNPPKFETIEVCLEVSFFESSCRKPVSRFRMITPSKDFASFLFSRAISLNPFFWVRLKTWTPRHKMDKGGKSVLDNILSTLDIYHAGHLIIDY